jgi:hypothetical protein
MTLHQIVGVLKAGRYRDTHTTIHKQNIPLKSGSWLKLIAFSGPQCVSEVATKLCMLGLAGDLFHTTFKRNSHVTYLSIPFIYFFKILSSTKSK